MGGSGASDGVRAFQALSDIYKMNCGAYTEEIKHVSALHDAGLPPGPPRDRSGILTAGWRVSRELDDCIWTRD